MDPVLSHHTSQERQAAAVPELPNNKLHQSPKQSHAEDSLLRINVILAIVSMEIITDDKHCTGTKDDFIQCSRKMNFKLNILIRINAILVMVIMELTTDNIHPACNGGIFNSFCLSKNIKLRTLTNTHTQNTRARTRAMHIYAHLQISYNLERGIFQFQSPSNLISFVIRTLI